MGAKLWSIGVTPCSMEVSVSTSSLPAAAGVFCMPEAVPDDTCAVSISAASVMIAPRFQKRKCSERPASGMPYSLRLTQLHSADAGIQVQFRYSTADLRLDLFT